MKCPVCVDAVLVMSERKGIEIDYCPQCRGIWLDRGEIDKIIERSIEESTVENAAAQQNHAPSQQQPARSSQPYPHHHHEDDYHYRKDKKKSFWMELFD